jgi:hypothetical protein
MTRFRIVLAKLRALFRERHDDAEFAQEFAAHLDLFADDLVREGVAPDEARRQARLRVGGSAQLREIVRHQRGLPMLEELVLDLRFAARALCRSPRFAVTAALSLAVGVAANTEAFAFLYGYLIRPLPFADGARLATVLATPSRGVERWQLSLSEFEEVRTLARSFDGCAAYGRASVDLLGGDELRRLMAGVVSANLHQLLGIRPVLGRTFVEEDGRGSAGPVVLISEGLWRDASGSRADIVGTAVILNGRPHAVVGVLPVVPDSFPSLTSLWFPIGLGRPDDAGERVFRLVARLAPGVALDAANRELDVLSASLAKARSAESAGVRLFAEDLRADLLDDNRDPVLILYAVVSLMLVLACVNVATLLVTRNADRASEFAVRASLGAGRFRIIRQLTAENALLAIAGGALGVLAGV